MQRGALHPDESSRPRDVAAKAVDLRDEIVALEDFARLAQWERDHKVSAASIAPLHVRSKIRREKIGGDRLGRIVCRQDEQALDDVAQLANVAGPAMRLQ